MEITPQVILCKNTLWQKSGLFEEKLEKRPKEGHKRLHDESAQILKAQGHQFLARMQ